MKYVAYILFGTYLLSVLTVLFCFIGCVLSAIDCRKRNKALALIVVYNYWALKNHQPDLLIDPYDNTADKFNPARAIFGSIWSYYTDVDVCNSLRRFRESDYYQNLKDDPRRF